MNKGKINDLILKANQRQASPRDYMAIANLLIGGNTYGNYSRLINALGTSFDESYISVIERYIDGPDDMAARAAVSVLCLDWGRTEHYIEQVLSILDLQSWDVDGMARLIAISVAGEYLRGRDHEPLLKKIIEIAESEGASPATRVAAYFALARANGTDWNELMPFATQDPQIVLQTLSPDIVAMARSRLNDVEDSAH